MSRYVGYIIDELSTKPALFWKKIRAIEKEYGHKEGYSQTNSKLQKLYEKVGGK